MAGRDFRETISEALDELAENELKDAIKGVFSLETLKYGDCPACGERVQVATPDYKGYAAALAAFDGIGKGNKRTPEEAVVDDTQVEEALLRVMSKLPREDLERLANS